MARRGWLMGPGSASSLAKLMALSTFAGGRLWGARYGTAPPWALALHGWQRTHRDFTPVLEGLDAIALDLPGFGVAAAPPEPWSTTRYAEEVAAVLDELAEGPVVLLGHSFGARVACRLAEIAGAHPGPGAGAAPGPGASAPRSHAGAGAPGRVGVLVLTGAPLAPPPGARPARPALAYRAGRSLHRAGLLSERRMGQLRRRYGSADYRQASPVMRGVLVQAVAETATAGYIPGLKHWVSGGGRLELVWGAEDEVASLAGLQAALAAPLPTPALVRTVAGEGHILGPGLVAALRASLERHRPLPRRLDQEGRP